MCLVYIEKIMFNQTYLAGRRHLLSLILFPLNLFLTYPYPFSKDEVSERGHHHEDRITFAKLQELMGSGMRFAWKIVFKHQPGAHNIHRDLLGLWV